MKRKRFTLIVAVVLVMAMFCTPLYAKNSLQCEDVTQDKIANLVKKELKHWKGSMIMIDFFSNPEKYSSKESEPVELDSLENVKGEPQKITTKSAVPVYTISTENIDNFSSEADFSSILEETNDWFVPVDLKESALSMLHVKCIDGELKIIGAGYKSVNEDMKNIRKEMKSSKDFYLIKIDDQITVYLLALKKDNEHLIFPLNHSDIYENLIPSDTITAERKNGPTTKYNAYEPAEVLRTLSNSLHNIEY